MCAVRTIMLHFIRFYYLLLPLLYTARRKHHMLPATGPFLFPAHHCARNVAGRTARAAASVVYANHCYLAALYPYLCCAGPLLPVSLLRGVLLLRRRGTWCCFAGTVAMKRWHDGPLPRSFSHRKAAGRLSRGAFALSAPAPTSSARLALPAPQRAHSCLLWRLPFTGLSVACRDTTYRVRLRLPSRWRATGGVPLCIITSASLYRLRKGGGTRSSPALRRYLSLLRA